MKRRRLLRGLLAIWLVVVLAVEVVPPAAAQVPLVNAGIGLFRVINAINRRNRVYQAARDTQQDFNAYYNALQNTARAQLVSGELRSLRQGEGGLQAVRAGAYIRLTEGLRAEQAAISRAIDAETNQARREFNRTLVRQLQEIATRLPGAQQIIGQVRDLISNMRSTIIGLQAAAASNQPLDALTQRLAEQVSSSAMVQQAVRNLGTMVGPDLDRSLGGALTQVNSALQDVSREASSTVTLLDGMDAQVAALDLTQAHPPQREVSLGPVQIRLTERATAAADAASQALAFLSLMQSPGGTTREQLYNQIRQDRLNERNAALLDALQHVRQIECLGVGQGEYETARGMLGKEPETTEDPLKATYMVCRDRTSGQPVRAWIVRVILATGTAGAETAEATAAGRGDYLEAHGELQLEGESVGYGGGGNRIVGTEMVLRFYSGGGAVDGQGRIFHDVWAGGCSPERFEDALTFTGSSDKDGNASGTLAITTYIFRSEGCDVDGLAATGSLAWEATIGDGVIEGQVINEDGPPTPFHLEY